MKLLFILILFVSVGFGEFNGDVFFGDIICSTKTIQCRLCNETTTFTNITGAYIIECPKDWCAFMYREHWHRKCYKDFLDWLIERYQRMKDLEIFIYLETLDDWKKTPKRTVDGKDVWTFGAVEKSSTTKEVSNGKKRFNHN
jgi:hypothetical protein